MQSLIRFFLWLKNHHLCFTHSGVQFESRHSNCLKVTKFIDSKFFVWNKPTKVFQFTESSKWNTLVQPVLLFVWSSLVRNPIRTSTAVLSSSYVWNRDCKVNLFKSSYLVIQTDVRIENPRRSKISNKLNHTMSPFRISTLFVHLICLICLIALSNTKSIERVDKMNGFPSMLRRSTNDAVQDSNQKDSLVSSDASSDQIIVIIQFLRYTFNYLISTRQLRVVWNLVQIDSVCRSRLVFQVSFATRMMLLNLPFSLSPKAEHHSWFIGQTTWWINGQIDREKEYVLESIKDRTAFGIGDQCCWSSWYWRSRLLYWD